MNTFGHLKPGFEPIRHPNIKDIYWAAGIYEGEGCCTATGGDKAMVTQKDGWLLVQLKELFGGNILKHGNVHRWQINGSRARGFLMTIYSLLSPRRQEQLQKVL